MFAAGWRFRHIEGIGYSIRLPSISHKMISLKPFATVSSLLTADIRAIAAVRTDPDIQRYGKKISEF